MDTTVSLISLHVGRFGGLADLSLDFRAEKSNLIIAANRAGKTSVCEFIRFMFYGMDEEGARFFPWEGEKTVSGTLTILCDETEYQISRMQSGDRLGHVSVVQTDTNREVDLRSKNPGEYFLGIDLWLYDRTVYFEQKQNGKIQEDLGVETLDRFAAIFSEGTGIYSEVERLSAEKNLLMNKEKTGEIDLLMQRRKEYENRMAQLKLRQKDVLSTGQELADCESRMAENSRRIVLIKAELKDRGDLRAADSLTALKDEIDQSEAKLRSIAEDARIGKLLPNRVAAEELRMQYAEYCRLNAQLTESKEKVMLSEDNLKLHNKMFGNSEIDPESLEDTRAGLERQRKLRVLFMTLALVFALVGAGAFMLSYFLFFPADLLRSGLIALVFFIVSAIMALSASVFRMRIERQLEEFEIESLDGFYRMYEKYTAQRQADILYQEQIGKEREKIRLAQAKAENILSELSRFTPGCISPQEIAAGCVKLLEAYATFCDLGERIKELRERYRKITSDDNPIGERGEVDETLLLERELLQLTQKNEELFAQKSSLESHLADLQAETGATPGLSELVSRNERGLLTMLERYRALELSLELAKDALARFERSVKNPIADEINQMLSFTLGKGESFEFGDNFELRYMRGEKSMPLNQAGGGLSELAGIALRLCIARRALKRKIPLIFDESFSYIDEKSKRSLSEYLKEDGSQLLIFASGSDVVSAFSDGAVIQTFGTAL